MEEPFFPEFSPSNLREIKPLRTPVLSYSLMAVTILIYIGQVASQFIYGIDVLAALGSKVNSAIVAGQYWRLLTPVFLHGSLMHIGFNMYALYVLGPPLERFYDGKRFLLLYFLAGMAGNIFSFIFTSNPSLGSSTAIFGLLGAYGVFIYENRIYFGDMARRSLGNIILVAVINFIIGLSPGIDNWGHLGGLLAGTAFAWLAGPQIVRFGMPPAVRVFDRRPALATWRSALLVLAAVIALLIAAL